MVDRSVKSIFSKNRQIVMLSLSLALLSAGAAWAQTPAAPSAPAATPQIAPATAPATAPAAAPAAPVAVPPQSAPAQAPTAVEKKNLIRPSTNAYNGSSQSTLELPNSNPALKKPTGPVDPWKVVAISENNPSYTVDVKYPQFDPVKGSDPSKLNDEIKRYVIAQIDAGRTVMPAKMQHIEGPKPLSYVKGECQVTFYNENLCSVRVDLTNYAFQSAHPVESLTTFNYRLDKNAQFGLKEVFRPDFKFVPVLSKICIANLSQGLDEEGTDWVRRGAAPEDKNFGKFQLNKQELQIIFEPYTIDNGSDGYRTVPIVWDRLRGNVSLDPPFHKLVH